jgi:hypothetical protein
MRFDARSAAVLQKASRGPAAISLRLARAQRAAPISRASRILTGVAGPVRLSGAGGTSGACGISGAGTFTCLSGCHCTGLGSLGATAKAIPAKWQVDPTELRKLVAAVNTAPAAVATPVPTAVAVAPAYMPRRLSTTRNIGFRGFGALGLSPEAGAVTSKVASTAGGAAATAAATTYGAGTILASSSVAGPIGLAVGVVIALAVSLFTKQYFNVGQSNQLCAQLEALWQKYLTIQGYVAGRALGWPTMNQLMHAATGAGLFPGNDMHLKFHEGTLQCAGHGDWVDAFTGYTAQGNPGGSCGAHNCMADALRQFNHGDVPAGMPDAIYFVDSILLPMNDPNHAKIPWIYNGANNPQVHQLLYDLADAYLAQFSSGTTPYVRYPQQQVGTPTAGAAGLPAPAQIVPAQTASTPSTQNMIQTSQTPVPGGSAVTGTVPGAVSTVPYYITPGGGGISMTPTAPGELPAGYTGAATTAAVSNPMFLYLGGGLLLVAVVMGLKHGKKGRRS